MRTTRLVGAPRPALVAAARACVALRSAAARNGLRLCLCYLPRKDIAQSRPTGAERARYRTKPLACVPSRCGRSRVTKPDAALLL